MRLLDDLRAALADQIRDGVGLVTACNRILSQPALTERDAAHVRNARACLEQSHAALLAARASSDDLCPPPGKESS